MRVFIIRPRGDPSDILEFLQRIKKFPEPFTWLCRSKGGRKFPVAGVHVSPSGLTRTPDGRFRGEQFVGVRPCAGDRVVFIGQESVKKLAYILAYADVIRSPEMCTPRPASLGDFSPEGAETDQRVFLGNLKIRRPLILIDPEDAQLYHELFLSPPVGAGTPGGCLRANVWILLPPYDVGWEYLESLKVIPPGEDYGNSRARGTPYDHTPRKRPLEDIEETEVSKARGALGESGDGEEEAELPTPERKLRKVSRGVWVGGRGGRGRGSRGGRVGRGGRGRGLRGGRGGRGRLGGKTVGRKEEEGAFESEKKEMEEEEVDSKEMERRNESANEEDKGTDKGSSWFSSCTIQ
eukprot:TRINITY_DN81598_c0_g1_i1.p1 TRINITY_DN81598_c0_g1~~TRINITY_DN81598_c0_g1_i1.p1  ORF type:complete len:350 (-),score=106.54 TRINITY_DN81598_c0_g1_i1:390-1439(-)